MDISTSRNAMDAMEKDTLLCKSQPSVRTFHLPYFQIISMVKPKTKKVRPQGVPKKQEDATINLGFKHVDC
jgi:hypothetical protein